MNAGADQAGNFQTSVSSSFAATAARMTASPGCR
jgi:hypothetical protein